MNFVCFRRHRIHEVLSIAIHDPSFSLSVMRAGCTITAKRIDVLFGVQYPRNIEPPLNGGPHSHSRVGHLIRHGLCHITLSACFVSVARCCWGGFVAETRAGTHDREAKYQHFSE